MDNLNQKNCTVRSCRQKSWNRRILLECWVISMLGGKIGLFYTPVPKVLMFRTRWFHNFGDFYWILIGLLIKLRIQAFQPLTVIYGRVILCIIIRDVNQFIGHCLNPLDPWLFQIYFSWTYPLIRDNCPTFHLKLVYYIKYIW